MPKLKPPLAFIFILYKNKKPEIFFNEEARRIICFPHQNRKKAEILNQKFIFLGQKWRKILAKKIRQKETVSKNGEEIEAGNPVFLDTYTSYRRQYEVYGAILPKKDPSKSASKKVYFFVLKRPESQAAALKEIFRKKKLSAQQRKMVSLLLLGLSNKEMATELGLSVNTVKTYMKNLATKLGVRSRLEIVAALSSETLPSPKSDSSGASMKRLKK